MLSNRVLGNLKSCTVITQPVTSHLRKNIFKGSARGILCFQENLILYLNISDFRQFTPEGVGEEDS